MNGANAPYLKLLLDRISVAPDVKIVSTTGVVAIEHSPASGRAFDLHSVHVLVDTIPTTAGDLVIQVLNGSDLYTITKQDMTAISADGYFIWTPQVPLPFAAGESVNITYSNPDARTVKVRSVITSR